MSHRPSAVEKEGRGRRVHRGERGGRGGRGAARHDPERRLEDDVDDVDEPDADRGDDVRDPAAEHAVEQVERPPADAQIADVAVVVEVADAAPADVAVARARRPHDAAEVAVLRRLAAVVRWPVVVRRRLRFLARRRLHVAGADDPHEDHGPQTRARGPGRGARENAAPRAGPRRDRDRRGVADVRQPDGEEVGEQAGPGRLVRPVVARAEPSADRGQPARHRIGQRGEDLGALAHTPLGKDLWRARFGVFARAPSGRHERRGTATAHRSRRSKRARQPGSTSIIRRVAPSNHFRGTVGLLYGTFHGNILVTDHAMRGA